MTDTEWQNQIENAAHRIFGKHYLLEDPIVCVRALDNGWWIGVRSGFGPWGVMVPGGPNATVDMNIIGDTCYLLDITIKRDFRGRGHGAALYRACEDMARTAGCKRIEQTPSGWTPGGETRASYLERHGWTIDKAVAYKELPGQLRRIAAILDEGKENDASP